MRRYRAMMNSRKAARAAFVSAVKGRSVAIVGGARSLLEHGDGAAIDECDVVIRVNWPRDHDADPARAGARTDWHYRASGMREEGPDIVRKPRELVRRLRKGFPTLTPRTGVVAVADVLELGAARVYVAGFDCYQTGHSVNPRTKRKMARGHCNLLDHRLLQKLCCDDRAKVDAVLASVLATEPIDEVAAQAVHNAEVTR